MELLLIGSTPGVMPTIAPGPKEPYGTPAAPPIEIRPMEEDDAAALVRFHGRLSSQTTYLRFFSIHPELTSAEVERFTHVDHREREALVAVVDDEVIGVARFDRIVGSADAEVAFVVADVWQGCGVGSALFQALARRAGELGIGRFIADTLPHNRRMLGLFRRSGRPMSSDFDRDTVRVVLDLGRAA